LFPTEASKCPLAQAAQVPAAVRVPPLTTRAVSVEPGTACPQTVLAAQLLASSAANVLSEQTEHEASAIAVPATRRVDPLT